MRETSRFWVSITCMIGALVASPALAAPSFDCARAGTPAEKLICDDDELSAKDRILAALYKKVLAHSSKPADLPTSQANWLSERDRACVTAGPADADRRRSCMMAAYDRRIKELKPLQPGAAESLALCQNMADRYQASLARQTGQSPGLLEVLAADKSAHFSIAPNGDDLRSLTMPDAADAATYVSARFKPDARLKSELNQQSEEIASSDASWVSGSANRQVFAISTMAGSMRCESTALFFRVTGDRASLIDGPMGVCTSSQFASLGRRQVLIQGAFVGPITPQAYHLADGYTFTPWDEGWQLACNISITYEPILSLDTDKICPDGETDCSRLRHAVLALMIRYKQDPAGMPHRLVDELNNAQRDVFTRLKNRSDQKAREEAATDGISTWPGDFVSIDPSENAALPLNFKPVALPLIHNGKVLLVLAGHQMTTGSRDLPNFNISVKQEGDNGLNALTITNFSISMDSGRIKQVSVSLP